MFNEAVLKAVQEELRQAYQARADGFEGRCRVCARRAAGLAVKEYFRLRGESFSGSAYDVLVVLRSREDVPDAAREAAARLTERVDASFQLPLQGDLAAEAERLVKTLNAAGAAG